MNNSINVDIKTQYLAEQSEPNNDRFVFSYTITLTNDGKEAAQLMARHWIITDDNETVQEVKGVGVIGQQPLIQPGEQYSYSSGVVLPTEIGTMTGSYQMKTTEGLTFDTSIPEFALILPSRLH